MQKYLKYILPVIFSVISYFISFVLIITLSASPDGTNTDFGFIEVGICIIIAVIIACTTVIVTVIKESNKKN